MVLLPKYFSDILYVKCIYLRFFTGPYYNTTSILRSYLYIKFKVRKHITLQDYILELNITRVTKRNIKKPTIYNKIITTTTSSNMLQFYNS